MHFAQAFLYILVHIQNYMHIIAYIFPLMQKNFCRHVFCLANTKQICAEYKRTKRTKHNALKGANEKMQKFSKKRWLSLAAGLLCFSLTAAAVTSYSWYFKPTTGHAIPEVIPEASRFIGDHAVIYLGSPEEKRVYLTFDAGYENGNVEKILNVLKEKNVPGAFFILPQLARENTALVLRMHDEGHLVCNHTKTHRDMSKITDFETFEAELRAAEDILRENTGFEMDKFYRPPEGRFSEQNLEFADRLGYTTVFWSLAYADWDNEKQMSPERALDLILARTHNGCVALLHPTSATNAAILGRYIDALRADGYTFGSLTELAATPDRADKAAKPEAFEKGGDSHEAPEQTKRVKAD